MPSSKLASVLLMLLVAFHANSAASAAGMEEANDGKHDGRDHKFRMKSSHHHNDKQVPEAKAEGNNVPEAKAAGNNNDNAPEAKEEGNNNNNNNAPEAKAEENNVPDAKAEGNDNDNAPEAKTEGNNNNKNAPEAKAEEVKAEPEEAEEPEAPEEPEEPKAKETIPEGCDVGKWSAWSACAKTCGDPPSVKTRTRHTEPKNCVVAMEAKDCEAKPCPIDCEIGEWGKWSECSKKCRKDGAVMTRTREVKTQPAHGGQECCGDLKEEKECGEEPKHCKKGPWTPWSECSTSCNTGITSRTRGIETEASCGGAPCICDYKETINCHKKECPTKCEVGTWSEWSECPKKCGGAFQERKRNITQIPYGGGEDCPELVEIKNCAENPCDKPCVVTDWSPWSDCSASCYGLQQRTREVKVPPEGHGKPCDDLAETKSCNHDCVIDCKLGDWGPWSKCSKTCGQGAKSRKREVLENLANGGAACGDLTETDCCGNTTCPEGNTTGL